MSVHPRVCGEQLAHTRARKSAPGSSPRVRGTVNPVRSVHSQPRFIPACAGNRLPPLPPRVARAVHPRVCGEQRDCSGSDECHSGSSPRVRGTGAQRSIRRGYSRFIPACAGNRQALRHRTREKSVHPRVCGEQTSGPHQKERTGGSSRVCGEQHGIGADFPSLSGSSPRVRGTV